MKYLKKFEGMYYSDEMKKTIEDILVELRDDGLKYFFNDIREGLTITLEKQYYDTFKKSDIVEPFLMLEDYMREEWGNDIRISYEYVFKKNSGKSNVSYVGCGGQFDTTSPGSKHTKVDTITDIKVESLVKVKFMCSK
jgi:hypothetical protein